MAGGKEIRTQIKSIQNTRKITSAMQMVAASKMRKAQDRMAAAKPYAERIRTVIHHVGHSHPEYKHPFMIARPVNKIGVIVVSTDRGLCGGLNVNMLRRLITGLKQWDEEGKALSICTIGRKGNSFLKRLPHGIVAHTEGLGDTPHLEELIGAVQVMLEAFDKGEIDELYLVGNEFVNTMTQAPFTRKLLPIALEEDDKDKDIAHHWDYIYEPDAPPVMDELFRRYIESQVYQAVVENVACEMSARMIAMKAATDNAGELIDNLQLAYNKARQAAITQEISEIVGGAAAVSG
ncbi:MAG: F0F1 ATP synthase subunit gamma [Gammaproteobacteria bacterium]